MQKQHASHSSPASPPTRHIVWCYLPHSVFVLLAGGIWLNGYWLLAPFLFLIILVPLLDTLTKWQDDAEFDKNAFSHPQILLLNWNTRLYALLYIVSITFLCLNLHHFSPLEQGSLIASMSLIGGICFAAAHELLHAKHKIDNLLQRLVTTFLFYPHYKLIHIRSHHVHAGTDHDENTAWLNESIYAYILRTIPGSMIRSWQMEAKYHGFLSNKMLAYAAGQLIILTTICLLAGSWGLLFYALHIISTHIVLESVNYVQHYGLLRKMSNGKYEKTKAEHSWDSYHFFSSYVTYRVGHHSHHHIAAKPYYLLATEEEAPKLPAGYFWTIAMVMMPPWWRRVTRAQLQG